MAFLLKFLFKIIDNGIRWEGKWMIDKNFEDDSSGLYQYYLNIYWSLSALDTIYARTIELYY